MTYEGDQLDVYIGTQFVSGRKLYYRFISSSTPLTKIDETIELSSGQWTEIDYGADNIIDPHTGDIIEVVEVEEGSNKVTRCSKVDYLLGP